MEYETTLKVTLATIEKRARRGSLRNFQIAVEAELTQPQFLGYSVKREGENTLVIYRSRKEGGFLGIGAKTIREPVMKITMEGRNVQIADQPLDADFAIQLAEALESD